MTEEVQTCRKCGITKPLSGFSYRLRNGRRYPRNDCKECGAAATREWRHQALSAPATLPLDELQQKRCSVCRQVLPFSEFGPHRTARLGLRSECRKCGSEKSMKWNDANWDKNRDTRLRREFGITLEQYNAMLAEQGGVCAICGEPPTVVNYRPSRRQGRPTRPILVVDHDHGTGKIRGLLCIHCNRGLGFLKDDAVIVRFALKYLEERA